MTAQFVGLLAVYLAVLLAIAPLLGRYIRIAVEDGQSRLTAWGRPLERGIYRLAGIDPRAEMGWKRYASAVLAFNIVGIAAVYGLQRVQGWLPLNPAGLGAVSPDSALNTAISFVANTNWQGYAGESTMSYLTQMLALTVQNFVSAATGIAVLFALIRGLSRHCSATVGNFWADMVRSTLYVLLPLSLALALALVSQGVIQNVSPYLEAQTIEPVHYSQPRLDARGQPVLDAQGQAVTDPAVARAQVLAMGPVASQESIKLLGTNGGGFFNANSAHPYENPTPLANFLEMLAILAIPAALCFTFGEMVGSRRQGIAILAAMTVLFAGFALSTAYFEQQANPMVAQAGAEGGISPGGNMEGKETRFGIAATSLFATVTTAASCGAVNGMHDSLNPMGGLSPMLLMQLGEVVYGGVGSGLYGMLAFAILGVFIAGLMIGRTPEYLGKKIEAYDMKMVSIVILATPLLVLAGTALAVSVPAGQAGVLNPGIHGFSEILYALTSAANNNGSAFAGLSANTPFYNVLLGIAMWFGRYAIIVAILAMAGSLAAKRRLPAGPGSMPTTGPLFVVLLIGAVLMVGALTYVPALALGPVAEHLQ
ncbi:potassium-transporting ATPase subunit A [Achromobacter denitrificans]|uniref:potassium-transporting ATPase subunit KdpA n=1 Tax=Achromobacter denitrificans TaxID=32002 RepID=UPI000787A954|nr:potassium-transporting ATPase subunit KdpA [Achromobacter denitrificans]ASC63692.1 potassium-transporting ATPase subunit KdpA [Achromobacter denitrificans]OLU09936.1 potassium-transporting ATPase subunit KdpA [Achromobacter denitrificans]QKH45212.1 potassium-transporting ATPase subunit KdpA [Achromobacter denitrificans]QKH53446.1 potassium-transporting ATPase subunit KdpA [Achromobacter denitrificans]CAB3670505.1 Potassium-transporting ATPase potassium-binding subunit [Achromobacter denitri